MGKGDDLERDEEDAEGCGAGKDASAPVSES